MNLYIKSMGQDSGDDQWYNRHAAKPCIGLIVFFVFYSPQGGSNYWLNALPRIAKLGI